ncbi:MAG: hypothetical protein COU07_01290 [Candidatus Harrisonbacteria bacterium CG10_big_fil_rev_8_21_14_0_10_40_38]|uniref:DUF1189 domain-containing protein n=1 Tax=Candidatus Harrisonbacteria bacterium CG10_big_fil_rev_8_21_14_0_10_40_38 TaxID=1974583 RepID=A0A2H0UT02_9BACT|nr:MAG: hypothetical protein COU07_01290 [Candidatus Harrisonbacteria bacterium CG10_big_fil_rev_8_21_14_0_10_40_38]
MKQNSFIATLKSSIYNPKFYSELRGKKFSFSILYFTKLALLFALLGTLVFSVTKFPSLLRGMNEFVSVAVSNYPAELVLTVKDGSASTNVSEPYFIDFPDDEKFFKENEEMSNPKYFAVIDTVNPINLDQFESYDSLMVISKNSVTVRGSGDVRTYSLSNFPDVVIDRDYLQSWVDKISPWIPLLAILILVVLLLFLFSVPFFYFFDVLIGAFIVMIISGMRNVKLNYSSAFRMGIHLLTPIIVLDFIFSFSSFLGAKTFIFDLVLFTVFALINIGGKKREAEMASDVV